MEVIFSVSAPDRSRMLQELLRLLVAEKLERGGSLV